MESLSNIRIQKLIILSFVILFIILQTFFPMKGIGFFLVLPSIFMLLTYKPDSISYGSCFILGLINDMFSMQLLGVSSIVFLSFRFIKILNGNISSKDYLGVLKEYLVYAYILLISVYLFMLSLGVYEFDLVSLLTILLIQLFGFFVCYYAWIKIFEMLEK